MTSVLIAISGGINSCVICKILQDLGYKIGLIHFYNGAQNDAENIDRVNRISKFFNVPLRLIDLTPDFEDLMKLHIDGDIFERCEMPNLCIYCNRKIKFGKMLEYADGYDFFATGQYIIKDAETGDFYRDPNNPKDQSYAISYIPKKLLKNVIFPIGGLSKDYIRDVMTELESFGLILEKVSESQDFCLANGTWKQMLHDRFSKLYSYSYVSQQRLIFPKDMVINGCDTHDLHTIGQKKFGHYITKITPSMIFFSKNKDDLYKKSIKLKTPINWFVDEFPEKFSVQLRYRGPIYENIIFQDSLTICAENCKGFFTPQAGQLCAFYDESGRILGGGIIDCPHS